MIKYDPDIKSRQDYKMFVIKTDFVLFLMFFHGSDCERRIVGGLPVNVDKGYVVYLVKAPIANWDYAYWMCGGAIVSSRFVITSAACVKDVDYLYVIAGYSKYVPDYKIAMDPCTKAKAKKVIYTCSPKGYDLRYEELDYWSFVDIALVKVEKSFEFNDDLYTELCSYKPTIIPLNYDSKYTEAGTDTMVFGWGHRIRWRKPGDSKNYNSPIIKYSPTLILNKTACKAHYDEYRNMSLVIDDYMICTLGAGNLNDRGTTIVKADKWISGCTKKQVKILGFEGESCEDEADDKSSDELSDFIYNAPTRREFNQTYEYYMMDVNETADEDFYLDEDNGRRFGICQNDHGGPLVTWVGAREVLIGVASVFKVSKTSECMGPFLYTSTARCSLFLECVLNSGDLPEPAGSRAKFHWRSLCDRPAEEKGFDIIERHISWKDYSPGPTYNEMHKTRETTKQYVTKNIQDKVFAEQKFRKNKAFPAYYKRSRQNDKHPAIQNNIVKVKNRATERSTQNWRHQYSFPKVIRSRSNVIAMRPVLPIRN